MVRQCLIAAITHRPGAEPTASTERSLEQSMMSALSMEGTVKGAKCEDLEKIVYR